MRNPFDFLDELRRHAEEPLGEIQRQLARMDELRRQIEDTLVELQRPFEHQRELLDLARGGVLVDTVLDEMKSVTRGTELQSWIRSEIEGLQSSSPLLSTTARAIEALSPQIDLDDWNSAGQLASELVQQNSQMARSMASDGSSLLQWHQEWWDQLQATQFRPFESIARQIGEDIARLSASTRLEHSYASDFLTQLAFVQEAEDEEALSSALSRVVTWFLHQVWHHPASASVYLALLSIFLTIAIFFHQQVSAELSEARILRQVSDSTAAAEMRIVKQISESEQRMLRELHQRIPPPEDAVVLVVTRRLHLRNGPSSKSRSLRILYPNTALVKRAENGLWLEVEFFDFEIGERRLGWVCRRFVEEMPSE